MQLVESNYWKEGNGIPMIRLWTGLALAALLPALLAHGQGKGKGQDKDKAPAAAQGASQVNATVNLNLRFGSGDIRIITDYYRPRMQQLPPGLEKKVARGGTLPPGWQKKVQPFPADLVGRLSPAPAGYRRVVSGQVAMLIYDATNLVVDILDLTRQ